MTAFRLLALAYALAALLIAPSWLTAEESPAPGDAQPPAQEMAPEPGVNDEPAAEQAPPADEAPVAVEQEIQKPTPSKAAAAETAQAEDDKDQPVAKAAADGSVTITDFAFSPKSITVNVGDSVTWSNKDSTVHTATANDGSFDTGNLKEGESGSATFSEAGTIAYICKPHPFMKGTVVVRGASSNSGGSDVGGTASDAADDDATTAAADDSDEDGLPATGAETLAIALLGLATLGAGVLLRRRETTRG